jgi:hypothetical protein
LVNNLITVRVRITVVAINNAKNGRIVTTLNHSLSGLTETAAITANNNNPI